MTRLRRIAALATLVGLPLGMSFASVGPVHAAACPDPDNPCDLPPPSSPPKVGKPSVTFGCGTVTVASGDLSVTLPILPCPGPVLF
jgi:hypothetical protein